MKKIAFIAHGKLKRRKALVRDAQNFLSHHQINFLFTNFPRHAESLAQECAEAGFDFIIAAGGDGTLNEVINGVMQSPRKGEVTIGVWPLGSGNDFAKTLRLPADIKGLAQTILLEEAHPIDLMHLTYTDINGQPAQRFSHNITDVGMGGQVAEGMSRTSKWMGPTLTYQYQIIKSLLTYRPVPVRVQGDGISFEGNVMNYCVCNGKYFGSGLGISPYALPDDGMLNTVCIGEVTLRDYLRHLPAIRRCVPVEHPQVHYGSATTLRIDGVKDCLPIDLDGEFAGYTPLSVTLVPAAIRFLQTRQ
ncbi:MAG: diacylglycerol kinase family lipid kinase [Chitinophagales bacterium]|nr:diacylglycerol kinase family lipid kinase [Chitinophagales bacterium]